MVMCSDRPDKALASGDVKDLYIVHPKPDGSYGEPVNMGPVINSVPDPTGATPRDGDDREPWLSPDGNTLLFKSTRLATFDDPPPRSLTSVATAGPATHLFIARKVEGEWTEPTPLPPTINTPGGREHCPMFLRDGKTFCFASLRPGGHGESDIWCSQSDDNGETFSPPVNAGPAVNTASDDFHFAEDKNGWIHFVSFGHEPMLNVQNDIWYTKADGHGGYLPAANAGPAVNAGWLVQGCPAFHPSGALFFFAFVNASNCDIFVVDAA